MIPLEGRCPSKTPSLLSSRVRRVKERRSLSYITNFPLSMIGISSYHEGEKGGEVDK